jgi:hypothetical protein
MRITYLVISLSIIFSLFTPTASAKSNIDDKGPLSKVTFIHYRRGFARPELPMDKILSAKPDGVGKPKPGGSSCYSFIASGARWKSTEPVMVNPSNSEGIDQNTVTPFVSKSLSVWEHYVSFDIFGDAATDSSADADFGRVDNKNVVKFDTWNDPNVIAVTNVWGYLSGPPRLRELVEWDMILNQSYEWSTDGDTKKMDLENILVHELGHSAGMADLYEATCNQETMFGYADLGETSKRDLNNGDIAGIKALYN